MESVNITAITPAAAEQRRAVPREVRMIRFLKSQGASR